MSKIKKRMEVLIKENMQDLLKNPKELEVIEQRIDQRHMNRLPSS